MQGKSLRTFAFHVHFHVERTTKKSLFFNKTYSCPFLSVQKETLFKILHSCICGLKKVLLDAEMINALLRILFASSTDCSYRILLTKSLSIEVPYHSKKSLLNNLPQSVKRGTRTQCFLNGQSSPLSVQLWPPILSSHLPLT